MYEIEVVKMMHKKTARNWTAEETNVFCLILLFKKAEKKEVIEAELEEFKITFIGELFRSLNDKALKGKESVNKSTSASKKVHGKYSNLKQLWMKLRNF